MPIVPAPVMWHAGPDYLRITTNGDDATTAAAYQAYNRVGLYVADWLGEAPGMQERWGASGYAGSRIGAVGWGARQGGAILQVSGPGAEEAIACAPPWDNCPRLDVALTMWMPEDIPDLAARLLPFSDERRRHCGGRPWALRHINGAGDGDTLYIGSRSSAVFVRIYDKWRESEYCDDWRYAWRVEVEYKEGRGADWLPPSSAPLPGREYWAAIVVREFERRVCALPRLLPSAMASASWRAPVVTSTSRRLRWLAGPVSASIARLLSAGVEKREIASALCGSQDPAIMWALAELGQSKAS